MKKITLIATLVIITQLSLKAQPEIGLQILPSTTWLINNNASDQGDNLNYRTSFALAAGLNAGYFFNENIGVGAELNIGSFNQKYEGELFGSHYDAADNLMYISIPVLFKLKSAGGFYFEIGPQFNLLSSAEGSITIEDVPDSLNISDVDIEKGFNQSLIGGVFGFGGRFRLNDNLSINTGLRFFGGLADATEEFRNQTEFNEAAAHEEIGTTVFYAHTEQDGDFRYEKTMALSGSLVIGVIYSFGSSEKK